METVERAQIRLLLEHLSSEYRAKADEQQKAMQSDHAARGRLQSGATVKESLRIVESVASDYVKATVAAVSDVSQDTEAFAIIATDVTLLLRTLGVSVDQAVRWATEGGAEVNNHPSVSRETKRLFMELQHRVLRLLEIHRFTFTRPSITQFNQPQPAPATLDQGQPQKNKGGKPLAGHWDEMWSAIAVQLYVGDLQPRSQAEIERMMLGWFADRNLEIGETAIRERARQLWRKYGAAK